MSDYARAYFDQHAAEWLAGYEDNPKDFPLGWERVRVSLSAATQGLAPGDGLLVDLGCGGGELCSHAAQVGYDAVGVDIAPGMIDEAEQLRASLDPALAERIRFVTSPFGPQSGLADGCAASVTALGLIEYTPDDGALLSEFGRLLRPGGVAVVTCRNLLFSLFSANDYTERVIRDGSSLELLAELREELAKVDTAQVQAVATALAAIERPAEDAPASPNFDHGALYTAERRQHTPRGVARAAAEHGLAYDRTLCVHPHPFPPSLEQVAPRSYNQIARALQPVIEESPLGLVMCSTFVAVLRKQ